MEIEAKLIVPSAHIAQRLAALECLGEFVLDRPHTLHMRDTFFDTPRGDLRSAQIVFRLRRRSDGKRLINVKHPTTQTRGIHRRPETEVPAPWARLPRRILTTELPGALRRALKPLSPLEPLVPFVSLVQTRHLRRVRAGRRTIAEWSVDRVQFHAAKKSLSFFELEVELKSKGTDQDLTSLLRSLQAEWQLEMQSKTKFERAVAFTRDRNPL
jgi:inorganic triphosphatase YgiF